MEIKPTPKPDPELRGENLTKGLTAPHFVRFQHLSALVWMPETDKKPLNLPRMCPFSLPDPASCNLKHTSPANTLQAVPHIADFGVDILILIGRIGG